MMSKNIYPFVLSVFALVLAGCTSTEVKRQELDAKIDLSGYWNDYDAQTVSRELMADCLAKAWIGRFEESRGRTPVVIVGHVYNRSDEQINTQVITKFMERELMNSGKVIFVASAQERSQLRDEREDQAQGFTLPESMKAMGRERGADVMLIGSINSVKDEVKDKFVMYYQVNLELLDLESNEKLWIGQKEVKKFVKKKKFSL